MRQNNRKQNGRILVSGRGTRGSLLVDLKNLSCFFIGKDVGRVKSTISSTVDSSELSLNRPPESLSQDILGGNGATVGHV